MQRTVAAQRQRSRQPCAGGNFKDMLRTAGTQGVDHPQRLSAMSLMVTARAGNAALMQALLEAGVDGQRPEEFGLRPGCRRSP